MAKGILLLPRERQRPVVTHGLWVVLHVCTDQSVVLAFQLNPHSTVKLEWKWKSEKATLKTFLLSEQGNLVL